MPKKVKKTKISNVKAEASAVKQVVNVRVGDQFTKRKTVKRYGRRPPRGGGGGGGGDGGLGIFNRPPVVATQSLSIQPTSTPAPVNEYNALLRALAEERSARMAAAPPLAPNTSPLTTNEQRNELLSKSTPRTPLTPIVQAYAVAEEQTIDKELYDDPLSNENMFVGSSRLGEKLAQKLPVSNFDYNDVEGYDDENEYEQEALVKQAEPRSIEKTEYQRQRDRFNAVYDEYLRKVKDANRNYLLGESIKSRNYFNNSQTNVRSEMSRIDDLIQRSDRPKKAGKG